MRLTIKTAMRSESLCQARCERVVRNGSTPPGQGFRGGSHATMWSNICKNCEKLVRNEKWKSSTIKWVKQSIGEGKRVPKFGADGGPGLPVIEKQKIKVQQKRRLAKAGDGYRESQKKEAFAKPKPVIMAAGKRIPLIKFPNRRASETQGSKAGDKITISCSNNKSRGQAKQSNVGRASGGGGLSQAMPSLPSGTASSQPPWAKLSEAEIEAVLLGAELEKPAPKNPAPKEK